MEKKKRTLTQNVTNIAACPNTNHKRKYRNRLIETKCIKVQTINHESAANKKFDHLGFVLKLTDSTGNLQYYTLSNKEFAYTTDGRPSYMFLVIGQRTSILDEIKSFGNTPSRVVQRMGNTGMNAGQIGQCRRWHCKNWRVKGSTI
jgi:hypothetical protein